MKKNRYAMLNSSQIDATLAAIDFATDYMDNRSHILGFMDLAQRLAARNANLSPNDCDLLCACLDSQRTQKAADHCERAAPGPDFQPVAPGSPQGLPWPSSL